MNVLEFKHKVSDDLLQKLRQAVMSVSFESYVTAKGNRVWLEWADASSVDASELLALVPFKPNRQGFTRFAANGFINVHVDDKLNRSSCLSVALLPELENFAPVNYHDSLDLDARITETYHYNRHPIILNTKNPHSMVNNDHDRYMLQIQYAEDISEFVKYARS